MNLFRIRIPLPENAELRSVEDIRQIILEKIKRRLVIVQVDARAHIDLTGGCDRVNPEGCPTAWTAAG